MPTYAETLSLSSYLTDRKEDLVPERLPLNLEREMDSFGSHAASKDFFGWSSLVGSGGRKCRC